jgi:hypothetical protein
MFDGDPPASSGEAARKKGTDFVEATRISLAAKSLPTPVGGSSK